jgi:hypothetical protein
MTDNLTPEAVAKMLERLRAAATALRSFYSVGAVELIPAGTMDEAADMMEALAAKLAKVERERDELRAADRDHASARAGFERRMASRATAAETKLTHMTTAWSNDALRVEELEAEVARLRDEAARVVRIAAGLFPGGYDDNLATINAALQPKETDHE